MHPMLCIMRLHLSAMYRSYIYIQGDIHTLTAAAIFRKLASERHTDIHNWPLQSFSQDYGLASHTTHAVNVNFIRERRELQFNVDSEQQIFWDTFHGNFIYSQSFCQKSARGSRRRNIFLYFIFDDWPGVRTQAFASNKPTHYVLDHGDFIRKTSWFFIWRIRDNS